MSFEVGQIAGGYEFVDVQDHARIGRGYKVRNVLAERMEVLRVLPKEPRLGREEVDRFLREIKVHARLSHPNIVSFYNATEIDTELVMTSEFFEGVTLEQRLSKGRMPLHETIVCMSQVLSALHYAHELGVIHREVSPANILLGWDGTVKLTGFGMAKSTSDPELTQVGTVMGWLEYMSPEQVHGSLKPDARTDIYSAGAVLYEMVSGRVPFAKSNQFDLMMAHVNECPEPPPGADPAVARIILTALSKDPSERYQTARQFRDALESLSAIPQVEEKEPAPEAVPDTDVPPAVQPEVWGTRKLALTGLLTFVVMLAILLLFLKIAKL
ncbi:MAG TPA: serine/threonine-protein kinase [Bryobacteraceae bacterium]|nr:serine/threonine-protein kinase [Bryobacteraceae bacterium]